MGRILVIRGGAIGDFILTLPVLQALRTFLPDNEIEVLGYPRIAELALAGGLANRIHSIESRAMAGFFARRGRLDEALRDFFSEFDLILSYLYDPDGIFAENVGLCSTGQYLAGPHRPDETLRQHATECFLKPLERLAIFEAETEPRLTVPTTTNGAAGVLKLELANGRWMAVHPGSGSEKKNWPERKWAELLSRLVVETDLQILLVGGEAEGERLERLAARIPEERRRVARSLSLTDLAQLLSVTTGFLGHDSGISHLAAALERKGLLLWAGTPMHVWRPRSDRIEVLHHPNGITSIVVDEVVDACKRIWP